MACDWLISMEKILMNTVETHLANLPDSNMMSANTEVEVSNKDSTDDLKTDIIDMSMFICTDTFPKSIENGFIIVTALNAYIECAVNTIIRNIINCHEDFLLKNNLLDKIQLLYFLRKKEFTQLRGNNTFACYRANNQIRNELIHFKDNMLSFGIPSDYLIGKHSIVELFTKSKMKEHIANIYSFVEKIYLDLDLVINTEVSIIGATGFSYELASYALEKDINPELLPPEIFKKLYPDRASELNDSFV